MTSTFLFRQSAQISKEFVLQKSNHQRAIINRQGFHPFFLSFQDSPKKKKKRAHITLIPNKSPKVKIFKDNFGVTLIGKPQAVDPDFQALISPFGRSETFARAMIKKREIIQGTIYNRTKKEG